MHGQALAVCSGQQLRPVAVMAEGGWWAIGNALNGASWRIKASMQLSSTIGVRAAPQRMSGWRRNYRLRLELGRLLGARSKRNRLIKQEVRLAMQLRRTRLQLRQKLGSSASSTSTHRVDPSRASFAAPGRRPGPGEWCETVASSMRRDRGLSASREPVSDTLLIHEDPAPTVRQAASRSARPHDHDEKAEQYGEGSGFGGRLRGLSAPARRSLCYGVPLLVETVEQSWRTSACLCHGPILQTTAGSRTKQGTFPGFSRASRPRKNPRPKPMFHRCYVSFDDTPLMLLVLHPSSRGCWVIPSWVWCLRLAQQTRSRRLQQVIASAHGGGGTMPIWASGLAGGVVGNRAESPEWWSVATQETTLGVQPVGPLAGLAAAGALIRSNHCGPFVALCGHESRSIPHCPSFICWVWGGLPSGPAAPRCFRLGGTIRLSGFWQSGISGAVPA